MLSLSWILSKLITERLQSLTTENNEVLSTKSFEWEASFSETSLIQIKNICKPSIELWGVPSFTLIHCKYCPFQTKLYFLIFIKSFKILRNLPITPFSLCLKIKAPCQTFKENASHLKSISNTWQILCAINKSWFTYESPGLNHDWLDDIRSIIG